MEMRDINPTNKNIKVLIPYIIIIYYIYFRLILFWLKKKPLLKKLVVFKIKKMSL